MALFRDEECAPVDKGLHEAGSRRDRLFETGESILVAVQPLERAAADEEGIRGARVDSRGFTGEPLRIIEAPCSEVHQAERKERAEIPGISAQDIAVQPCRLREIARVLGAPSLLQQIPHVSVLPTAKCAGGAPR